MPYDDELCPPCVVLEVMQDFVHEQWGTHPAGRATSPGMQALPKENPDLKTTGRTIANRLYLMPY